MFAFSGAGGTSARSPFKCILTQSVRTRFNFQEEGITDDSN